MQHINTLYGQNVVFLSVIPWLCIKYLLSYNGVMTSGFNFRTSKNTQPSLWELPSNKFVRKRAWRTIILLCVRIANDIHFKLNKPNRDHWARNYNRVRPSLYRFQYSSIIQVYEYYLTLMVIRCDFQSLVIIRHLIFLLLIQKKTSYIRDIW
jgi:hypothetical protein